MAWLHLWGEVDVATCDRLRGRVRDLLEAQRAVPVTHLEVELGDLGFLDVVGLQVLLDAQATLQGRGGSIVLRSARGPVRRLLEVLDRDGLLPRTEPLEQGRGA